MIDEKEAANNNLFSVAFIQPFTISGSIEKGIWYIGQKQYESAGKIFRSILKNNPSDSKALYYLGKVYDLKESPIRQKYAYQQGTHG